MNSLDMEDDDNNAASWTPPTEAELKVIEARRERSNKISSLMGQYLLKGYKMLATSCAHCDCILLEDRQKNKYCIACSEVDADTKKDNPAVSEHAARRTVQESQHRQPRTNPDEDDAPNLHSNPHPLPSPPSTESFVVLPKAKHSCEHYQRQVSSESLKQAAECVCTDTCTGNHKLDFSPEITRALCALKQKLGWATRQLETTTNLLECQNLVKLMSETVNAAASIQQFKSS